jgi:hypothetical protein
MINEHKEYATGVICLRCGIPIPVQISSHSVPSKGALREIHSPLAIVRCGECGKEASYLENEIIALRTLTNTMHAAA